MKTMPYTYTNPDDPGREDDGLFGPESVTWRIMSSRIMWVAVVRALYLQALHPRVIRGTLQNAATITEPVDAWARLKRTRKFIETRTFGTTAEAERAGRRVRTIHQALSGADPDGTRSRAWRSIRSGCSLPPCGPSTAPKRRAKTRAPRTAGPAGLAADLHGQRAGLHE